MDRLQAISLEDKPADISLEDKPADKSLEDKPADKSLEDKPADKSLEDSHNSSTKSSSVATSLPALFRNRSALRANLHTTLSSISSALSTAASTVFKRAYSSEIDSIDQIETAVQFRREPTKKKIFIWCPAAHYIVTHRAYKFFTHAMIILASAQMGLAHDVSGNAWKEILTISDHVFTVIFLIEVVVGFLAYRCSYILNVWSSLDVFVAISCAVDVWLLPWLYENKEDTPQIFKLFRSLRLLRIVKMLKVVPELMLVTEGLLSSLRSMLWIFALVGLILYSVSIYCVEAIGNEGVSTYGGRNLNEDEFPNDFNNYLYFGSLQRSMVSLISMVLLAEWSVIVRPVFEKQPLMVPLFVSVIILTTFGVMNIIIGVVVERTTHVMTRLNEEDEERRRQEQMDVFYRISDLMFELDADGDKLLSLHEMQVGARNQGLQDLLKRVRFPSNFTYKELHTMLDQDGSGKLSRDEFINGMFRLVYNDDFQRDCLFQLAMGQIQASQRRLRQDIMKDFRSLALELKKELGFLRQEVRRMPFSNDFSSECVFPANGNRGVEGTCVGEPRCQSTFFTNVGVSLTFPSMENSWEQLESALKRLEKLRGGFETDSARSYNSYNLKSDQKYVLCQGSQTSSFTSKNGRSAESIGREGRRPRTPSDDDSSFVGTPSPPAETKPLKPVATIRRGTPATPSKGLT